MIAILTGYPVAMDFSSRVYLCFADVIAQVPTAEITTLEVLDAGYADLMQRAQMISKPNWKRSFLEAENSNRALLARWENLNLVKPN